MKTYWGIDLGGTKIEGVVLESLDKPDPLCRLRIETESSKGYEHILQQISNLIDSLKKETGTKPEIIGLGHPGAEDPKSKKIKNSNTTCLIDKTLRSDLQAKLGCSVNMANDANCFALAENAFGAARGADVVFGIIMGTGVGGEDVIHEKVLHGCQGIAGEWGHNVLIENGPPCYCGQKGCVEALFSGPALESFYQSCSGKHLSFEEIVEEYRSENDPHAAATIDRLVSYFGKAAAVVINILDPDCIVLGGGLSNVPELYTKGKEEAAKYVFNCFSESGNLKTKIIQNELGDSAGVFGAAMLVS